MQLYDLVYNKDVNIRGILINEHNGQFNILCKNYIMGVVSKDDPALEVVDHVNMQTFFIDDILHSGRSGTAFKSKVGEKYDRRRGKIALLDMDTLIMDVSLSLYMFSPSFFDELHPVGYYCSKLRTTGFYDLCENGGYTMLWTMNSIYKLEKIKIGEKRG